MSQIARKSIAAFALLAGTMIPAVTTTAANRIVEVFNPAIVGSSVDYGQMGYIDDDGNFSFTAPGAIPEPDTWAMLIMGFGLVGLGLRRRARLVLA